jgi:hypothetical protein
LEDTQVQVQDGVLRALLGDPQLGGVYEAYGTPRAYGPGNRNPDNGNPNSGNLFNGNRPATGYYGAGLESSSDNSGGGYLSNDGGFLGYSPYYGNNGGYGLSYGAVDLGSSNHSAPAYDGGGYYSKGISGNGYAP